MEFKPSVYQEEIFEFVKYGYGNAVISAVAGSGKSTTIIKALDFIKPQKRVLFLAFNNGIVEELRKKVHRENTDIKTLHSLGFSILRSNFKEKDITVYEGKYRDKLNKYLTEINSPNIINVKYSKNVLKLCDLGRYFLVKNKKELLQISNKYSLLLQNDELDVAEYLINWGKNSLDETNLIDYTDMIYLPNVLSVRVFKYDFIIIDEAQDLSVSQMSLFMKCFKQGSRFIAVGDEKQCQPAGTKILMSDSSEKNIEDVLIGDKIVSYNSDNDGFYGYYDKKWMYDRYRNHCATILNKKIEKVNCDMYTIKAGEYTSSYTHNHICMSKFNYENTKNAFILYLMQSGDKFRIGIYPLFVESGNNSNFGLRVIASAEKADKAWILNIYDNLQDAYNSEQVYSYKFGIPQTKFKENAPNDNQINIDYIWNNVLLNNNLYSKANKILSLFNKYYDFPYWKSNDNNYYSRESFQPYHACNIFPIYMDFAIFDPNKFKLETNKIKNYHTINIDSIQIEKNKQSEIISLEVSNEQVYVADGILTHNCINAFAGSDIESFNKLRKLPNTIELPLSISYRCPKNIVSFVKKTVPEIEHCETAINGFINYNAKIEDLQDGDMVICRNTLPLVKLYIQLINDNVKCYLKGVDVGMNLLDLIQDIDHENVNDLFEELYAELQLHIQQNLIDKNLEEDYRSTQSYNDLIDKIECLKILANNITTKQELIDKIIKIFSDETKEGICLSTIHKAKGLEADNVYILNKYLTPSKFVKQSWEIEQEHNLEYVSFTRSKRILGFING